MAVSSRVTRLVTNLEVPDFNLDAASTASTTEVRVKVHNPGFGPLNWKFTAASLALINSVSWIDDVSPQSSRVDPLNGDVACGGYSCAGEVVTIRVMQDDWMRSQSNDGTALKTVEHAITPQVDLYIESEQFPDLVSILTLRMTYSIAPGTAGTPLAQRRRLQQMQAARQANGTVCVERSYLLNSNFATDRLLVPSRLDMSQCGILLDKFHECELEAMGFQLMFQEIDNCADCKCKGGLDEECLRKCSPRSLYERQMQKLLDNKWVDRKTRAVFLDVAIFYQNFNLFQVNRIMFEYYEAAGSSAGSYVATTTRVRTFRIYRYVTAYDNLVMIFEILLVVLTVTYTFKEIIEIKIEKWDYFKSCWNYVDWANLIILYVVFALRTASLLYVDDFDFDSLTAEYIDFAPIGFLAIQELNVSAINFFLIYFKLFKYLGRIPRMDSIMRTISTAAFDLILFMVMFLVIMFGFSAAYYVTFGAEVERFRSLGDAMGALMRMLLGDFDYDELSNANGFMAPILFYSYNLVVFFILLNMFLAIVADSYAEVKGNQSPEDLNFYRNMLDALSNKINKLFKKRDQIKDFKSSLMLADADMDALISEEELIAALAHNPKAVEMLKLTGVKDLMAKYDLSNDGKLSKEELKSILQDLALKEAEIQEEIQDKVEEHAKAAKRLDGGVREGAREAAAKVGLDGYGNMDTTIMEERMEKMEESLREMNRNIAKKLSLMTDLMMSLSDQVSSVAISASRPDRRDGRPGTGATGTTAMPLLR